ncbi:MAG TPA: hypothetical protein VNZ45_00150, partial [Bacteroidia bacterium]|nr:hypothetical protein [Bacteroidia bacterium]
LNTTRLLAQDKKTADSTSAKPAMQWVYHHDAADTLRSYFMGTHKYPKNNLLQAKQVNHSQPNTDLFDIREK